MTDLPWIPQHAAQNVRLHPERVQQPLSWRKPTRVFVNSMSDLFHEQVPDEFVDQVFAVMALTPRHTYQILTKRPERMRAYLRAALTNPFSSAPWPLPNAWLGVSVENQRWANERIPLLLSTPAAVRFLSCEPLLGPVNILTDLLPVWSDGAWLNDHVDWVIAGAESGPGARPAQIDWYRSLRDQCVAAGVPFFLKQDAIRGRKLPLPELDGRQWVQWPDGKGGIVEPSREVVLA